MQPTIKQMAARANSGHIIVLRRLLENGNVGRPLDRVGDMRGFMVCLKTLASLGLRR